MVGRFLFHHTLLEPDAVRNLREFFDPDLKLPIGPKTYTIKSPTADEGLRLRLLLSNPDTQLTDEAEVGEYVKLMGAEWVPNLRQVPLIDPITEQQAIDEDGEPVTVEQDFGDYQGGVWSEMLADGITWPEIAHAGRTALIYFGRSTTLGELVWENGLGDMPGNQLPPKPETVTGERSSNPQRRKKAKRNRKRK